MPLPPNSTHGAPQSFANPLASSVDGPATAAAPLQPSGVRQPYGPQPPLQWVNSRQVTLDYEVVDCGPSGLSTVDVYLTTNNGRTWQRHTGEENLNMAGPPDFKAGSESLRRSITVELPGEGIFGVSLVVQSGAGRGKAPPQNGDPPQMLLAVDTVPPVAKLWKIEPDPVQQEHLVLVWEAKDDNLGPESDPDRMGRPQGWQVGSHWRRTCRTPAATVGNCRPVSHLTSICVLRSATWRATSPWRNPTTRFRLTCTSRTSRACRPGPLPARSGCAILQCAGNTSLTRKRRKQDHPSLARQACVAEAPVTQA